MDNGPMLRNKKSHDHIPGVELVRIGLEVRLTYQAKLAPGFKYQVKLHREEVLSDSIFAGEDWVLDLQIVHASSTVFMIDQLWIKK